MEGDPSTPASSVSTTDELPLVHRFQGLVSVAESITSCREPEELFRRLAAELERVVRFDFVAFVLHDSFGFEFATIAAVLDTTAAAARKLASRARAKVTQPHPEDRRADWEVVDAFMAAAKNGDFDRLLRLLAPGRRDR